MSRAVFSLEQALGYHFADPDLLRTALTHRSYGMPHNERLEFLGDSILNCVIALKLFQSFPNSAEGDLSRLRSNLVRKETLYHLAQKLNLGAALLLGEGELRSGGQDRPSMLADALEAILGAIYLDTGFSAVEAVISSLYAQKLQTIAPGEQIKDPKTRLQEYLQRRHLELPKYAVIATQGDAHEQSFQVMCEIAALKLRTEGQGSTRRLAEQGAAEKALLDLERVR